MTRWEDEISCVGIKTAETDFKWRADMSYEYEFTIWIYNRRSQIISHWNIQSHASNSTKLDYSIALILQQNRLRWYGHVLRKDDDDWVKKCMEYEVQDSRPRGRPKRTWKEVVREDCQACKLNKEDAVDRCKWRKVIKEVRWPGWVWASECFFWYWPTRVVPDKRPLNGCCCRLQSMVYNATLHFKCLHLFILIPGINVS